MSSKLLNPMLHRLLEREFGEVLVIAEGEELQGRFISDRRLGFKAQRDGTDRANPERPRLEVQHSGEEYRVNCPFCNDDRRRLFVNHRWAVKDEHGNKNLWLAHCWNEECLVSHATQQRLWDLVFACGRPPRAGEIKRGIKLDLRTLRVVDPPGPIIPISELARNVPNHEAVQYLLGRGYDLERMEKLWGVGYCTNSRYPLACERIYIPIIMGGKLRGWQMRMTRDWKKGDPPKYWSCPHMRRRFLMYNYDRAKQYRTPWIVEGPIDTWSCGFQAMGAIGKTVSPALISKLWKCKFDSVVVMLDPEPDANMLAKKGDRYVHHIEKLASRLEGDRKTGPFAGGVCRVYLPLGTDPGSLDRDYMKDYVNERAKEQGVKISFAKRT